MPNQRIVARLDLPEEVQQGAVATGLLVIANEGDETVELVSPFYHAALNLVVFDRLWNQVSANPVEKVHIALSFFELAPSQSASFQLDGLTFTSGTARMAYELEPGIYYVLAVYHPGTGRLPEESSFPITVASNVVKLTVY